MTHVQWVFVNSIRPKQDEGLEKDQRLKQDRGLHVSSQRIVTLAALHFISQISLTLRPPQLPRSDCDSVLKFVSDMFCMTLKGPKFNCLCYSTVL